MANRKNARMMWPAMFSRFVCLGDAWMVFAAAWHLGEVEGKAKKIK